MYEEMVVNGFWGGLREGVIRFLPVWNVEMYQREGGTENVGKISYVGS